MKRIGLLTGGGDCPGLNAAIRAVVRRGAQLDLEIYAVYEGFKGLASGNIKPFPIQKTSGILPLGGTLLRTSRFNPLKTKETAEQVRESIASHELEGLIVIGGEGSLRLTFDISRKLKIPCIGIPKTIDNDVWGTDATIGFDTAVETATQAIDKLHTTAESHNFVMVVEVMGRHTGWIALKSGLAGGADMILIPEVPVKLSAILNTLEHRKNHGKNFSILVVAEDAGVKDDRGRWLVKTPMQKDEYGHIKNSGAGNQVARLIHQKTGLETRVVVLGYVQRGGSPTPADRILATRFGLLAAEMAAAGKWNRMTVLRGNKVTSVPLSGVVRKIKKADVDLYRQASYFFN